jgi:hypothetical protein
MMRVLVDSEQVGERKKESFMGFFLLSHYLRFHSAYFWFFFLSLFLFL